MINNSTTNQQKRRICLRIHYDRKQMLHFAERCFFYKYIELKTVSISYHNFKTCCRLMRVLFIILIPKNVDFSLHEIIWMISILLKSFRFLLHAFFYFEYCGRFILIVFSIISKSAHISKFSHISLFSWCARSICR